jgi:molybdopterin-guanine dinucleotide biosynthesis protein
MDIIYKTNNKSPIQKIVSIIGTQKSGKTYLLNKLSAQVYEHGY